MPMSEEELKAFLETVQGDATLQERLKAAQSPEQILEIAKDLGHDVSLDNIDQLSEDELDGVAGGGIHMCCKTTHNNTHG